MKRFGDRQFDTHSQMTRQAGADGQPFLFRHDANGNVLETESPLGVISKSTYDGADRPKVQIQDAGGINAEVRYAYSANGQVEQVVDPKGLATRYVYDGFGTPQGQLSPDTGTDAFTVDAMGNRTTRTDARGVKASYSYDVINRLRASLMRTRILMWSTPMMLPLRSARLVSASARGAWVRCCMRVAVRHTAMTVSVSWYARYRRSMGLV